MTSPGAVLYRFGAWLADEIAVSRVLDPWLADFRYEYAGASHRWERTWVRLVYSFAWVRQVAAFREGLMAVFRRIVLVTILFAVSSVIASQYFWPKRFKSEAFILVVPQRVSPDYVRATASGHLGDRLNSVSEQVLSRTRLERIIDDLHLYRAEREHATVDEIVRMMRANIALTIAASRDEERMEVGGFRVAFTSADAQTAQRVAERLANLFIETNLLDREVLASGTTAFLETQIATMRAEITRYENTLESLRAQSHGRPLSQADLIPYDVLKESYKALLVKAQESKMVENLERRMIGEQFKVLDPPRLPTRPVGPNQFVVAGVGGFSGLLLALGLIGLKGLRARPTLG